MSVEKRLIELGIKAFEVNEKDINVVERLKGGMSNYTYLVKVNNKPYVFRLIGDDGLVLVNPETEIKHLDTIKPLGFTPDTVYFDPQNGDKISHYVEGKPLALDFEEGDVDKVALMLKTLHEAKLDGADYGLKVRLRHYEKLLKNTPSVQYHMLKMFWLKKYDEVYSGYEKVLCHGDAQRSNIVKDGEKLYLLDWEFTGLNDPFYDIASFGNINFEDSIKLLESYLGSKPTLDEINKVKFFRMYQVLQWHIVATYKEDMGLSEKLHVDFKAVAGKYLNMASQFSKELRMVR